VIEKDVSLRINEIKNVYIGSGAKIIGKLTYKASERIPTLENIAVG
jgi:serine acetyltransferase